MKRELRLELPGRDKDEARRSVAASVVFHVVLFLVLSSLVSVSMIKLITGRAPDPPKAEHVTYVIPQVEPPPPVRARRDTATSLKAKAPPAKRQEQQSPPTPPVDVPVTAVVPPIEPPSGIPASRAVSVGGDSTDRRMLGRGIPPGLLPGIKDPRLLGAPGPGEKGPEPAVPYVRSAGMDSSTHAWVQAYWDSIAVSQMYNGKSTADWTIERGGKKYGIDPAWIYFGKFKLPTALLALLPINVMGNPTAAARNRELESMRYEINFQARRAVNEEAFQRAVKELRVRKDAEYKAKVAAQKKEQ